MQYSNNIQYNTFIKLLYEVVSSTFTFTIIFLIKTFAFFSNKFYVTAMQFPSVTACMTD